MDLTLNALRERWQRVSLSFDTGIGRTAVYVVATVWTAAAASLMLAHFAVKDASATAEAARTAKLAVPLAPTVASQPLSVEETAKLVKRLDGMAERVEVRSKRAGEISIIAGNAQELDAWLLVLNRAEMLVPDVRWDVLNLCAGQGCRGGALVLEARIQRVRLSA